MDLLTVVDPGPHVIEASAPGKAPFRQTITLAEGEQRTVPLPALEVGDGSARAATAVPGTSPAQDTATKGPRPETKTNPVWVASVATGVTGFIVGVPAGYVWGMMALLKGTCSPMGSSLFCASDGVRNTWLAVAAVSLSVGVVGTIGIAALPRKIQVAPTATPSGAGAVLVGRF